MRCDNVRKLATYIVGLQKRCFYVILYSFLAMKNQQTQLALRRLEVVCWRTNITQRNSSRLAQFNTHRRHLAIWMLYRWNLGYFSCQSPYNACNNVLVLAYFIFWYSLICTCFFFKHVSCYLCINFWIVTLILLSHVNVI